MPHDTPITPPPPDAPRMPPQDYLPDPGMPELARLDAGPLRRGIAAGMVAIAGTAMMLAGGNLFGTGPAETSLAPGWGLGLAVIGACTIGLAAALWRATAGHVVLTEAGLFDHRGICLAHRADIAAVITAPFAFKPSNGFTLRLHRPQARAYAPGLYWRWGRRVGIGGVPAGRAARLMADRIAALIAE